MLQDRIEPNDIFPGHLTGPHTHIGAAGRSREQVTSILESGRFRPEDRPETVGAALAPVAVVIAGDDIPGLVQAVEDRLGQPQLLIRSKLCDIARDYDELQRIIGIDVLYGASQIVGRRNGAADMGIGYMSEGKGPLARNRCRQQAAGKN